MTTVSISDTTPRVIYSVGATPDGSFVVPFPFFDAADIHVAIDGDEVLTSEYTVVGTAVDNGFSGGTVELDVAVSNVSVLIWREIAIERTTDISETGPLPIRPLNTQLAKTFGILQQLRDGLARTFQVPRSEPPGIDMTLPAANLRANKLAGWGDAGEPIAVSPEDASSQAVTVTDAGGVSRLMAVIVTELGLARSYGVADDGVTDNAAAFAAWLATPGRKYLDGGDYLLGGAGIELLSGTHVVLHPEARILAAAADQAVFKATDKSRIAIEGGQFVGADWDTAESTSNLLGMLRFLRCDDVDLADIRASNARDLVTLDHCNRYLVENLRAFDWKTYAVAAPRCEGGTIRRVRAWGNKAGAPTLGAYGLMVTGNGSTSPGRTTIEDVRVAGVRGWDGLMAHDFTDILISDFVAEDCRNGIDLSVSTAMTGQRAVLKNIDLTGTNTDVWSGVGNAINTGLLIGGPDAATPIRGVTVSNVQIRNFCKHTATIGANGAYGGIAMFNVENFTLSNFVIEDCNTSASLGGYGGLYLQNAVRRGAISNGVIRDCGLAGIMMHNAPDGIEEVTIDNVVIAKVASSIMLWGVRQDSVAARDVELSRIITPASLPAYNYATNLGHGGPPAWLDRGLVEATSIAAVQHPIVRAGAVSRGSRSLGSGLYWRDWTTHFRLDTTTTAALSSASGTSGWAVATTTGVKAGDWVWLVGAIAGATRWFRRQVTAVPSGTTIDVDAALGATETVPSGARVFVVASSPRLVEYEGTWDIPSTASAAVQGTAVAMSTAPHSPTLDDLARAQVASIGATNWLVSAHVAAAGAARVVVLNGTGGTVDPASANLTVIVEKRRRN